MKKKLLLLVLSFALCLPTFAESMCVNLRNGETVSFNLEDVKDVTICETLPLIIDSVVDESETPLKFKILSDSTLEVIKDDSYKELDSVSIPAKVRIDGKVYDVTSIGSKAFYFCENLTKATIPSSITNINDEAFFECPYLEALIDNSNGIIYMGNTVFSSKKRDPAAYAATIFCASWVLGPAAGPKGASIFSLKIGRACRLECFTGIETPKMLPLF